jgi:hypothetical protein
MWITVLKSLNLFFASLRISHNTLVSNRLSRHFENRVIHNLIPIMANTRPNHYI